VVGDFHSFECIPRKLNMYTERNYTFDKNQWTVSCLEWKRCSFLFNYVAVIFWM